MYRVIEHRARKYLDPVTGKIHIAEMPDDIRKGGMFGADISKLRSAGYKKQIFPLESAINDYVQNYLGRNQYMAGI